MNYQKHYDLLISTRLKHQEYRNNLRIIRYKQNISNRCINTYFEKHHIIPKCLNGTDDKSNLILLTPREHYIARWSFEINNLLKKSAASFESMINWFIKYGDPRNNPQWLKL